MDEEERKKREDREEKYFPLIDEHIKIIMPKISLPDNKMIEILRSTLIPASQFNHGFATRHGGVSTYSTLSSLNMVYSDKRRDPEINVLENRRRLALTARFEAEKFYMAKCVHGTEVWVVGDPPQDSYDALVTDKRQATLGAPGADCPTVLFCDPVKKVINTSYYPSLRTILAEYRTYDSIMQIKCGEVCKEKAQGQISPKYGPKKFFFSIKHITSTVG